MALVRSLYIYFFTYFLFTFYSDTHLTFLPSVEQMLPQITTKHALAQYAALLELPARRPTQDEAAKEGDELAVLAQYRLGRLRGRRRL